MINRSLTLLAGVLAVSAVTAIAAAILECLWIYAKDFESSRLIARGVFASLFYLFVILMALALVHAAAVAAIVLLLATLRVLSHLRWWIIPAVSGALEIVVTALPDRIVLVTPPAIAAVAGVLGGLAFWPFWLWSERLKESGESR